MRNLNVANAAAKSPGFAFAVSLIIPLIMGFGASGLADEAAPALPLQHNQLEILSLAIMAAAILALPIPYIFKWNWETKYFGALAFSLGSASLIGIFPLLCIICYSTLPLYARLVIALFGTAAAFRWCSRFVLVYKEIYSKRDLFNLMYEEEETAVYYLQQADKKISEQLFKIELAPNAKYFIVSFILASAFVPFAPKVALFIGLPFSHFFLAVSAIPLDLMFLGMATKMWLVFYSYPRKIKSRTKKPVYVDLSSPPSSPINLRSLRSTKNHGRA